MSNDQTDYDFFVSYASADNRDGWVDQFVAAFLDEQRRFSGGRTLTYFLDRDRIPHFAHWHTEIFAKGIARSRFFLAFLSPNYLASEVCRREWRAWVEQEIALHILSEGASPVYFVEVPGLFGKPPLGEQEMAAKVAELCAVPSVERLTTDLGPMAKEFRRRQLLNLVQPFRNEGVKALQAADTQVMLRKLAENMDARVEEAKRADASANTVPPYNTKFSGRLEELLELRRLLTDNRAGVIAGIHGLGGIGKTELAYTYAHAFAGVYPGGRFEVKCEYQPSLQAAVNIALGSAPPFYPHISDDERKHPDQLFAAIKRCLKQRLDTLGSVLLLLDNVSDEKLLCPQETDLLTVLGPNLHLLTTTRNVATSGMRSLVLDELKLAESLGLMEKYRPLADAAEEAAAGRIVAKLGGFALALELVAAKLAVTPSATYASVADGLGLDDLDLLAEQSDVVLRRHNHEKRLAAVLGPTLASLTPSQRRAMDYAALLPPDNLPVRWLNTLMFTDPLNTRRNINVASLQSEYVDHLVRLGLFTLVIDAATKRPHVKVHRLVQALLHREMRTGWRRRFRYFRQRLWEWLFGNRVAERLLGRNLKHGVIYGVREELQYRIRAILVQALDDEHAQRTNWEGERSELDALENLAKLWDEWGYWGRSYLLNQVALRRRSAGQYSAAERLWRRALTIDETELGADHSDVATGLSNLGEALRLMGRYADAEPLLRRALAIEELAQGPDLTKVALKLNNLALVLLAKSEYVEAEALLRRAMSINEAMLGNTHPMLGHNLNNLAQVLKMGRRYVEAEPVFARVIELFETANGPNHPTVATAIMNLSGVYQQTHRLAEAEPLLRRALDILDTALGRTHPETALAAQNLGVLLNLNGRPEAAEAYLRQALDVFSTVLGELHPQTCMTRKNLDLCLHELGLRRTGDGKPELI